MIIGLSGYARAGKDEAARGLQGIGFTRVGFADKLRDFLYALNPIVDAVDDPDKVHPNYGKPYLRVKEVIDRYGWDGYKESHWGPEIRQLLQRLGTECGRQIISDTIWIDAALDGAEGNIVVADCRFPNEAQAIKDRGGIVVRINRPGVTAVNAHISETSLDDWPFDYTIYNSDSVKMLHGQIRGIAQTHVAREAAIENRN